MYSDTGDLDKAKEYHEWALEIKKEQLGANHVDVATSYNNLGTVYSKTGDLEKAEEYYEWALKIIKEKLGGNMLMLLRLTMTLVTCTVTQAI